MKHLLTAIVLMLCLACKLAQPQDAKSNSVPISYLPTQEIIVSSVDTIKLSGTLEYAGTEKLAIIIAGSGPTDRDCNSDLGLKSNAFLMLAEALQQAGISSYRYDKRGVAKSTKVPTESMTLYDRVVDIKAVVEHFSADFDSIILVGHSEGVIVGMMAATEHPSVSAFVAVSGPSINMKDVLIEQMAKYPKALPILEKHFEELENDKPYSEVNPMFVSLFNESMRPFMKSAMEIDPSANIKKLTKPTLIINGACDVQVPIQHAQRLHENQPGASLLIVDGMGHLLKELESDCSNAQSAYQEGSLPLNMKFVDGLIAFINRVSS